MCATRSAVFELAARPEAVIDFVDAMENAGHAVADRCVPVDAACIIVSLLALGSSCLKTDACCSPALVVHDPQSLRLILQVPGAADIAGSVAAHRSSAAGGFQRPVRHNSPAALSQRQRQRQRQRHPAAGAAAPQASLLGWITPPTYTMVCLGWDRLPGEMTWNLAGAKSADALRL